MPRELVLDDKTLDEIATVRRWLSNRSSTHLEEIWLKALKRNVSAYTRAEAIRLGILVNTYCEWHQSTSMKRIDGRITRVYLPGLSTEKRVSMAPRRKHMSTLEIEISDRENLQLRTWLRRQKRVDLANILKRFFGLRFTTKLVNPTSVKNQLAAILRFEGFAKTGETVTFVGEQYAVYARPGIDSFDALI
jgi:hypothetical protein